MLVSVFFLVLRWLDRLTRPAKLASYSKLALVALYINVVSGALVRVTASGLGCPDWPLCKGRPVPPATGHAVVEFSNRILAAWVVGVCVVLAISAFRGARRDDRPLSWLALSVGGGTLAQAPLGGITVLTGLNPVAVMSHFLLALFLVVAATLLYIDLHGGTAVRPAAPWLRPLVIAFGSAGLLMLTSGAVVTMSGTHPGSFDAKPVPRLWNLLDATYWHVRVAVAFVVLIGLVLLAVSCVEGLASRAVPLAWAVVGLTAVQIVIGEWQWRTHLQWWTVLLHVANATALLIAIVALCRTLAPPVRVT